MNRDQQPMSRSVVALWRRMGRSALVRASALTLLACVSILGAGAHSSHQARAAQATTTASLAPAAYSIKSVTVSVSPTSFAGLCSPTMTFTFTGTITLNAGYGGDRIGYTWLVDGNPQYSSYAQGNPGDVTIPVGPYSYQKNAGSGTGATHSLQLLAGGVYSNGVDFSLTCYFTVTSVTLGVSGSCLFGLHYGGTIDVSPSPGGTLTYSWQLVNNTNTDTFATGQVTVNPDQTVVSLFLGNPFPNRVPPGTYGTILVVTTPNMLYSNPIVRTC